MKFSQNINNFFLKSNFIKITNYIVTSDSDNSYLPNKNKILIEILHYLYVFFAIAIIMATFYPFFLEPAYQIEGFTSLPYIIVSIFCFLFFLMDYIGIWITYPFRKKNDNTLKSLLIFPITGISIILLLSLLPSFFSSFFFFFDSNSTFIATINILILFKLGRLILLFKILPAFKIFGNIISTQKVLLINSLFFSIISFIIFALIIYHAEGGVNPKINNYWDAFYFTIICVTTIGFGDIVPITEAGKIIVIFISILGIIIFAVPSGIIAGSIITEMKKDTGEIKKIKIKRPKLILKDKQLKNKPIQEEEKQQEAQEEIKK